MDPSDLQKHARSITKALCPVRVWEIICSFHEMLIPTTVLQTLLQGFYLHLLIQQSILLTISPSVPHLDVDNFSVSVAF